MKKYTVALSKTILYVVSLKQTMSSVRQRKDLQQNYSINRYAILHQVHHLKTLNKNVLTHLSYYVQQQLKANLQLQNAKHSNLQIDEEVITPFTEVDGKIISVETNVRSWITVVDPSIFSWFVESPCTLLVQTTIIPPNVSHKRQIEATSETTRNTREKCKLVRLLLYYFFK